MGTEIGHGYDLVEGEVHHLEVFGRSEVQELVDLVV